ncbi:MAG: DUF975 family protein [Oscillospiraceae bacterium]|nr:DUF975 family protein [Oscillospiraceae bacterium]MCL2279810.1 DUF975 family protein [Oscillospiraceae bacterium]
MTKTRQEIKAYAKHAFASQRKPAILGTLLTFLPLVGLNILVLTLNAPTYFFFFLGVARLPTLGIIYLVTSIASLLTYGVACFLFPILNINLSGLFVRVFYGQKIRFSEPYTDLKINYGRKLGGYWWSFLWLYLWTLVGAAPSLFIGLVMAVLIAIHQASYLMLIIFVLVVYIPMFIAATVKWTAYCMQPYILAAHPNVTATNALKLSKRMTKGYRGKIFVMWLSFLGWHILNIFTLGILGIFYVVPYMRTVSAGYFVELRNTAIANGTINPAEFDGFVPLNTYYPEYHNPQLYYPPQYTEQISVSPQQEQQVQYPAEQTSAPPLSPPAHDQSQDQYPPQ